MKTKWLSRSTVFSAFFALTAWQLALRGLLIHTYVEVIAALHVMIVGRAVAQDFINKKDDK